MEWKLHGASEFRAKAKPTIAHVVRDSIHASVASTRMRLTRQLCERFCVEQPEQAAGDLAPNEALRMLKQQWDEFFHGHDHRLDCITTAIHPEAMRMPVMPYQPMHKAKGDVSQDRMQEILQKNAKTWPAAPKENAPSAQPPRPVGKLVWADRDPGSMGRYTTCHWYSCCQIGQGANATFEVWTRQPLTSGMKQLAVGLKTFREGIERAQADADEHFSRGDR